VSTWQQETIQRCDAWSAAVPKGVHLILEYQKSVAALGDRGFVLGKTKAENH